MNLANGYIVRYEACHIIYEHVEKAEKALGRKLPAGSEIHHVDENRSNNTNSNLVICPSAAYHSLLHVRTRAYKACGNANYRICWICRQWDSPSNMYGYPNGSDFVHRTCRAKRERNRQKGIM